MHWNQFQWYILAISEMLENGHFLGNWCEPICEWTFLFYPQSQCALCCLLCVSVPQITGNHTSDRMTLPAVKPNALVVTFIGNCAQQMLLRANVLNLDWLSLALFTNIKTGRRQCYLGLHTHMTGRRFKSKDKSTNGGKCLNITQMYGRIIP